MAIATDKSTPDKSTPDTEIAVPTEAEARAAANRRAVTRIVWMSSILWFAVPLVVIGVALAFVNIVLAVIVAVVVSAAVGIGRTMLIKSSANAVLRESFGGQPASPQNHARLVNLVEGLCIGSGIEAPEVLVIDDPGANLATFGAGSESVMLATTGLLESLGRVELEGVVAEGLGRIDQADAELAGTVAAFVLRSALRSGPSRNEGETARVSSRAASTAAAAFADDRHFVADLDAVSVTRFPPGLRTALVKMAATGTSVASATYGTALCWMCDPLGAPPDDTARRLVELVTQHPSMTLRIDLMAEL